MDVAKYIGLFLDKNRYCYLPNLGEFTVEKQSASQSEGQITGPKYIVHFKFSGGLIDDAFANFVANNERISIASAANAIKDFSVATRATLDEGGEVIIPSFGKFVGNGGKNAFIADPNISVQEQGIPIFKINTAATQSTLGNESIAQMHEKMRLKEPSSNDEIVIKPPSVNWLKIVALVAIAVIVLGGIAWAVYSFTGKPSNEEQVTAATETPAISEPSVDEVVDTNASVNPANSADTVTPSVSVPVGGKLAFGIASYPDRAAAERKMKKLAGFGHDVSVKDMGNGTFAVTLTPPHAINDTTYAKDSLRRFFNPQGTVTIVP